MITITESAKTRICELLTEESPNTFLRTFVRGGGCSGFEYGFAFDTEKTQDDFEFTIGSFSLIVDAMSMQYLDNAEIDYRDDLNGSNFTIKNPNAVSTCGCGSSFSI